MNTTCCIAGGGPAGMMLGLLLARAGVDVVVLEKHADFLRDFRGDTIHPSTLQVIDELGLLAGLLARPHQEVRELTGWIGDVLVPIADFSHVPGCCKFLAFMPQWDFLDFLAEHAARRPSFHLLMQTPARELIEEDGRVVGVRADGAAGAVEIRADLVVGADGRHSTIRESAGLTVDDLGAPMDVLWMRVPKRPGDPAETLGRIAAGRIFIMIDRADYWQCGLVIPKGSFEEMRARGVDAFRAELAVVAPFVADRVDAIASWDDVKLLTVRVDRLRRWHRPGLLMIGDAAHAMSPIGGVGINLAIQDAVASANFLALPLRERRLGSDDLQRVESRRLLPTRLTQGAQLLIQNRVVRRVLASRQQPRVPPVVQLLRRFPILRRVPGYLVGIGFRPEHVRSPELPPP